jgi:glycosyltransferase involved in cell wall biosynthesis
VVDTVDLEFVRDARGTGFSHGRAADTIAGRRERELLTYRQADGLVFVSSVEQARYRAHSERPERTWVVPILVELHTRCARPRSPVVVFVGNFWHAPNVDGIVWFAGEIWPLIRTAAPGATLRIVGSHVWDAVTTLAALDGVEVVGFAEDLDAVYDEAAVVIAPLRYGAGMKGKICEALAAAVPVVTTEIGIEGLDVRPGVDLLVADGPEAMAAAVAQLLGDPARAATVGAAGQRAIARQCLPQTMGPIVGDLAEFLRAPAGRRRPWWRLGAAAAEVRDATARATSQARRTLAGRGKGR